MVKRRSRIRVTVLAWHLLIFGLFECALLWAALDVGKETPRSFVLTVFAIANFPVAMAASWLSSRRVATGVEKITRRVVEFNMAERPRHQRGLTNGDEIAALSTAVKQLVRRSEDCASAQQFFLSNVAHELKTPLAVLLCELDAIRAEVNQSPRGQAHLASAEEEVRYILRTIEGMLALARSRQRQRIDRATRINLEDVVLRAVAHCSEASRAAGIRVIPQLLSAEHENEPVVFGDESLLIILAENLLRHAIRKSPAGETIEIATQSRDRKIDLIYRDRGPQITPQQENSYFELSYLPREARLDKSSQIRLAIVQAISRLHGGDVRVQPRSGGGSECHVTLPLAGSVSSPVNHVT